MRSSLRQLVLTCTLAVSQRALTCLLILATPAAYSDCGSAWARLIPVWHSTSTHAFDHSPYRDARAASGDKQSMRAALKKGLADGTLDSPEKIFGLLDAWNPDPSSNFLAMQRWFQSHDVKLWFKNQRFPYGWSTPATVEGGGGSLNAAQGKLSKGWPGLSGWPPFLERQTHLTLKFPEASPRTPQELVELVYSYTTALAMARLEIISKRAPWLSLPFGKGDWSYPQKILEELQIAERHLYQNLKLLQDAFPEVELPLKEADRLWRARWLQTSWELASRFLFPRYDVFKPFQGNRKGYDKFLEDLAEGLQGQGKYRHLDEGNEPYRTRGRVDWIVDRWRDLWLLVLAINLWDNGENWYKAWKSGELQDWIDNWRNRKEKYSPERLKKAVDEYQKDPEGFDVVNDHYNKQIADLKAKITNHGDPNGKLAKKIKELEDRRDFLKN